MAICRQHGFQPPALSWGKPSLVFWECRTSLYNRILYKYIFICLINIFQCFSRSNLRHPATSLRSERGRQGRYSVQRRRQPHTGSLSAYTGSLWTPHRLILVTTYGTLPEHQHAITIIMTIVIIIIVVIRTLCSTGFSIPPPTSKTSSTCLPYQGLTTALKSSLF